MKLKAEYNDSGTMVKYLLDTKDGQLVASQMPATVAGEIVQRAGEVTESGPEGYEVNADGEMFFPKDIFDFEEGELAPPKPRGKRAAKRAAKPASEE